MNRLPQAYWCLATVTMCKRNVCFLFHVIWCVVRSDEILLHGFKFVLSSSDFPGFRHFCHYRSFGRLRFSPHVKYTLPFLLAFCLETSSSSFCNNEFYLQALQLLMSFVCHRYAMYSVFNTLVLPEGFHFCRLQDSKVLLNGYSAYRTKQ